MEKEDEYTPEELAYKLIMYDDINIDGEIYANDNDNKDYVTYIFEILLTIYVEMIIINEEMKYMIENDIMDDEELTLNIEKMKLNIEEMTIENIGEPYRKKFKKIGYYLSIQYMNKKETEQYCKILLRDNEKDRIFFDIHKHNIKDNKKYHFVMNSEFKMKDNMKLAEIYAKIIINDDIYKISFDKIIRNEITNIFNK